MRKTSLLLLAAILAAAQDRPGQLSSGIAYRNGEVTVRYAMTIEPRLKDSQILLLGSGMRTTHDRMHRFIVDKASATYFGYDLIVEPIERGKRYRVTIEPLTVGPEGEHWIPQDMSLSPVPLPIYPPPQTVEAGDTIALDLLTSPDGRQKVVDYLEIDRRAPSIANAEPRDFTLDDGPLSIQFQHPVQATVAGSPWPRGITITTSRGSTIWFAFPNRGRFILSLASHDGFQKAGVIRGCCMTFEWAGVKYEIRTPTPIVRPNGAWNLYIMHDALYVPKLAEYPTIFGGTDRLENLLSQH